MAFLPATSVSEPSNPKGKQLFTKSAKICLLKAFANTLDPDQARQNVGLDLDQNCLTLWSNSKKKFSKKLILKKNQQATIKREKIPCLHVVFYLFLSSVFFLFLFFFSKSTFLKKYFRNTISVKQFGSRSKRRAGSESELFDSLVVFPKEFCKKMII